MPETFTTHEIAGGVWAAVAPGTAGPAVSNAAIIDLGNKTVVVDTFMTLLAAEELQTEAQRLTGRGPYLVVNSHWHSDHVYGNQVFADAPIAGTRRMLELIIEDASTRSDLENYAASLRTTAAEIAAAADSPDQEGLAAGTLALAEALASTADRFQLTLPDILIGDRLDIEGERTLSIIHSGSGHTESDLFVHIAESNVVVAGDLLWTGMHPKTNDGFPTEWAASVEAMAQLAPRAVIAGHGQVGTPADLTAMNHYMQEIDLLVAAVRAGDLDPATADPPAGSEDWQGLGRFRTGLASLAAG
ncbi:MAG: MBL fold metallo-hydrolase [Acidimicrobiia bacterium]|nr:MBL fold metallo-hydrolase [Acidimicrobiia bacterium]